MGRKKRGRLVSPEVSAALKFQSSIVRDIEAGRSPRNSYEEEVHKRSREQHALLTRADTFAVTREMFQFIKFISEDPDLPCSMTAHDLISPNGFVHFPEPMWAWHQDALAGASWSYDKTKQVSMIEELGTERWEQYAKEYPERAERMLREQVSEAIYICFYTTVNEPDGAGFLLQQGATPLSWLHYQMHSMRNGEIPGTAHQFLVAFLLVCSQKIASVERNHSASLVDREAAKKAKVVSGLRLVTLRREKVEYEKGVDSHTVDWSHRWIVRAHWRNQACGPDRKDRKWILVNAHVKGPPDKPLVEKKRIYSVER